MNASCPKISRVLYTDLQPFDHVVPATTTSLGRKLAWKMQLENDGCKYVCGERYPVGTLHDRSREQNKIFSALCAGLCLGCTIGL